MVATTDALTQAAAPSGRQSTFIVSPGFDGFFFFGSVLAVLGAWIASAGFQVNAFYVLATVAVISNGPHLASTWTRVYMDRREWRTRPIHILVVPLAIATFVASLSHFLPQNRILTSALLYWATWHFLAQNWGLLRIYQRRSTESDGALAMRLEKPLLFASVAWCLLHRLKTGPRVLFGTEAYAVDLPWIAIDAVGLGAVVILALLVALRIREGRTPWGRSALMRLGFLGCAFVGFFVPFILITQDGTTAFAAAACWHGFQYIGIVRFYHRNAWREGLSEDAQIVSWLSQAGTGRVVLYGMLLLALAGIGYIFIFTGSLVTRGTSWTIARWGSVVWLSFTFSHYYLDGVIWKLRRDKTVAARLLV